VLIYLDSSVLARAFLPDEPGHAEALALLEGDDVLVTGPFTWIEVTGLLVRAQQAGRLTGPIDEALAVLDDDMGEDGAVTVVRPLDAVGVELMARALVRDHALRALEALHIATALAVLPELVSGDETAGFASRDPEQAAAAAAVGLVVV
jgi:predicted nucleic acid-binding protein